MADQKIGRILLTLFICVVSLQLVNGTVVDPDIKEVHVVFMNHLDVGYDGVSPKIGFINVVLNTYFTEHFPRALNLSKQLKSEGYEETFIYTTHPYLVWMYINCPDNFTLSGVKLKCPNVVEKAEFINAIQDGTISYHAGPMNMQPENMNQMLFELSLNISQNLDTMLGIQRKFRTLSQRDVPGMTKAVIPTLLKKNIVALSVGVNDGTSPPAVPKIFTWKFDEENEIIAMWHPGGYPDNPGPYPSKPEGISVKDCVTIENFDKVLCFAFRTDNSGPPVNVQEILGYYEILRVEFPNAKIMASTFERFVEAVQPIKDKLPVITNEIGDTWISGIASDPRKMAEYRAVTQTLTECIEKGECDPTTDAVRDAVIYLIKPGEHTWGLPNLMDTYNWTNTNFVRARVGKNYKNCEQAWLEQREFTYLAVKKLGNHPVVTKIKERLDMIHPERPDLREFVEVEPTTFQALDGMQISFGNDGSIIKLYDPTNKLDWSKGNPLGQFIYRSYNASDFDHTNSLYHWTGSLFTKPNLTDCANPKSEKWSTKLSQIYKKSDDRVAYPTTKPCSKGCAKSINWTNDGNFGKFIYSTYDEGMFNNTNKQYSYKWYIFTKPNLTLHGNAVSKVWPTKVDKMYRWEGNELMLWLKLVMVDPASYIMYGAPREIWIRYIYHVATPSSSAYFDVDLRWFDKTATRIPETLMYYFSPSVTATGNTVSDAFVSVDDTLKFRSFKRAKSELSWKLRKLGELIDPSSVVLNGSQYLHAIDSDVRLTTAAGKGLRVVSLDVPLVSLSTQNTPASPFPVPLTPITQREITGFGFNIYNNMWDTNYIFYYPYKQDLGDENFRANFKILFE